MDVYLFVRHARLPESLFRSAGAGCRHIEHFDHRVPNVVLYSRSAPGLEPTPVYFNGS